MLKVYVDGGCRGNGSENAEAYGSFIVEKDGEIYTHQCFEYGHGTSNEAEYRILLDALLYLRKVLHTEKAEIYTDSALVYGQATQNWKVNAPNLIKLHMFVTDILRGHNLYKLIKVNREILVDKLGH